MQENPYELGQADEDVKNPESSIELPALKRLRV